MENIQKIKTNRINGFLDLDGYFVKRLGREFIDEEDLFSNGLIDVENSGRSDKFWILDEEGVKIALFKEPISYDSDELYAELISEEVSKILGIPTAHYDLARYNGQKGVISYNFIKEYDTYYSGFDIIADFYDKYLRDNKELNELYGIDYDKDDLDIITDKLNNLEDIWIILEDKYKKHPNRNYIVSKIVNGMVDKLIFDILMVNVDDHCDNWGEFDELTEGKMASPQFDRSHVLNLNKNVLVEHFTSKETIEDKELNLTVDNSDINKPLEVLKQFLEVSSNEYRELVINKVNSLKSHIDEVPMIIEKRTECSMPEYLKSYFNITMKEHLEKVEDVIYGKGKSIK